MQRITIGSKGDKRYETIIEDNVAKPVAAKATKAKKDKVYSYPFLTMTPGQSFLVPDLETAKRTQRGGYQKPYFARVSYAEVTEGEAKGQFRVWFDGPRVTEAEVDAAVAEAAPALDAKAHSEATKLAALAVASS